MRNTTPEIPEIYPSRVSLEPLELVAEHFREMSEQYPQHADYAQRKGISITDTLVNRWTDIPEAPTVHTATQVLLWNGIVQTVSLFTKPADCSDTPPDEDFLDLFDKIHDRMNPNRAIQGINVVATAMGANNYANAALHYIDVFSKGYGEWDTLSGQQQFWQVHEAAFSNEPSWGMGTRLKMPRF